MSQLIDHAKRELEKIGLSPEAIDDYLAPLEAFDKLLFFDKVQKNNAAQVLADLLLGKTLTTITDDPWEWQLLPGSDTDSDMRGIWQNKRDPKAFSTDGGKTYYYLDQVRAMLEAVSARIIRTSSRKT